MIELYKQNPALEACRASIEAAKELMIETYRKGGKLLLCGNGGSCADCDHIVGELLKGFLLRREISQDLREKIEKVPSQPEYIFTKWGVGYYFTDKD